MPLTRAELKEFSERVQNAGRPLVFYDDDADGLASYLLVQKANPDVIGVRAARGPELDVEFARKINENLPDLILILDKPRVDPEFFRGVQTPTIWLDHHDPSTQNPHEWGLKNLTYMNPRIHKDNDRRPVSYWVWRSLGGPLWVAAVGSIADWDTSMLSRFRKEYPKLAPKKNLAEDALYKSPLGELVRIFNFSLKGTSKIVHQCINTLQKIDDPVELLERTSTRARFIWKHYLPIVTEYERQRNSAKQTRVKDKMYVHVFPPLKHSLVAEVANEMLVTKNADIILVGRNVQGEVKFSMRSHKHDLPPIVAEALKGISGYGGGHKEACGGAVREDDWEEFVGNVKERFLRH